MRARTSRNRCYRTKATPSSLQDKGYTFLLVSPHLEQADDSQLDGLNRIYEYSQDHGYPFYCLTASSQRGITRWQDITGAEYPFCQTDETTLKTVIRSNPGLLLLKDGVIIRKWSHNALPTAEEMNGTLEKLEIGDLPSDNVASKILWILTWFVLPLVLLAAGDRLWQKWKKRSNGQIAKYQNPLNKQNIMRKKIVAGNWKMNMNLQDGIALAKELNETLKADKPNCGVVICTPFIHLASIAQFLECSVCDPGSLRAS